MSMKSLFRNLITFVFLLACAVTAQAQALKLWGNVIYNTEWPSQQQLYGIYSFEAKEGTQFTKLCQNFNVNMNGGGVYEGDVLKYIFWYMGPGDVPMAMYIEYNTKTWMQTAARDVMSSGGLTLVARCVAKDPTTGKVYGIFNNAAGNGNDFGCIDYATMERTTIKALPTTAEEDYFVLAANSQGTLFAINRLGNLVRIDKETGEATLVGATGVTEVSFNQSATFDLSTNRLYWAAQSRNEASNGLYEVNTTTGRATRITVLPGNAEVQGLYVPESAPASAPQRPADFKANFQKAALTGEVTFTLPTRSKIGELLAGKLSYRLVEGTQELAAAANVDPGTPVSVPLTLAAGEHTVTLTISGEGGEGDASQLTFWLGHDTPVAPEDVTLSFEGATATLTWSPVTRGLHDGYVEAEAVTYSVKRVNDAKVVAQGLTATKFSETVAFAGVEAYSYEVTATANGMTGAAGTSNKVVATDALELPYFEDFKDADILSLYQVIDQNKDGRTWSYVSASHCVRYNYSTKVDADDYMFTPALPLDDVFEYNLSFSVRVQDAKYPEKLEVRVGKGEDVSAYDVVMPARTFTNVNWQRISVPVRVKAADRYRLSFHAVSDKGAYYLFLDSLQLTEGAILTAPEAVTDFKNEVQYADGEGFKVKLTGVVPATELSGRPLTGLTGVAIYCDGTLKTTLTDVQPGQAFEWTDTEPIVGVKSEYTVTASNASGEGNLAKTMAYANFDVPQAPQNVVYHDRFNGTGYITWDPVSHVGVNGGWVAPENVSYTLYHINYSGTPELFASSIREAAYNYLTISLTGAQEMDYYSVTASNVYGESQHGYSSRLLIGMPFQLPFHETFTNYKLNNEPWISKRLHGGTRGWNLTTTTSGDGDGGSAQFWPTESGQEAIMMSGKIDISSARQPQLYYSYRMAPGSHNKLTVMAALDGEELNPVVLKVIEADTLKADTWYKDFVDLKQFNGRHYISVCFQSTGITVGSCIYFDDVLIRNVADRDLEVEIGTFGVGKVFAGQNIPVVATIYNQGNYGVSADDYTVSLYDASGIVATRPGVALKANGSDTLTFYVPTHVKDEGTPELWLKVDYAADERLDNNTSNKQLIQLVPSVLPQPTALQVTAEADGSNTLAWTAPEVGTSHTVVETFEDYVDNVRFTDGPLGDWMVYDGDKGETFRFDDEIGWLHNGKALSWVLQRPADIWGAKAARNFLHSGQKVLMAVASLPYTCQNPERRNDDWLISPELSALAQTISLWHRDFYTQEGIPDDVFEVRYSTTGRNMADFKYMAATITSQAQMTQSEVALPAGAKYFAIRLITQGGTGLILDDIQYEAKPYTLTGYRVYRDDVPVFAPIEVRYVDRPETAGTYSYYVSATYVEGESLPTEARTNAIDRVEVDAAAASDTWRYDLQGRRLAKPRQGLQVEGGRKIYR